MRTILFLITLSFLSGCSHSPGNYEVDTASVTPGTEVTSMGKKVRLYNEGGNLLVGKPITYFLKQIEEDPAKYVGKVMVINVVPSVDTKVCEAQTHLLGESKKLKPEVVRLSISRDLPFAQKRFAKDAKLENIIYLSDYKTAAFGKTSGLLMQGSELLARAVIVVDQKGVVKHLQVVPNTGHMPDMEKAFEVANQLAG